MNRIRKTLLVIVSLAAMLVLFSAVSSAAMHGDVDGDEKLSASDARLALRLAVGLDDSDTEPNYQPAAADVEVPYGTVDSSDARLILRAAVSLDDITENHFWTNANGEEAPAPSCTRSVNLTQVCAVCGETKNTVSEALGHDFSAVGNDPAAEIKCARCDYTMPSFNDLVNELKLNEHYYTGFTKSENDGTLVSSKFNIPLSLKLASAAAGEDIDQMITDMFAEELQKAAEIYTDRISYQRLITDNNFEILEKPFVSALKSADVTSIKVEEMKGVDFVSGLPDSITFVSSYGNSKYTENIADTIKAAPIEDVIKVSVTVKTEKYSEVKDSTEETSLQRIMAQDIREIAKDFNQKDESDEATIEMVCNDAQTSAVVTYYFDPVTFLPIAAEYDEIILCDQTVTVDAKMSVLMHISGNMRVKIENTNRDFYFFDGLFE